MNNPLLAELQSSTSTLEHQVTSRDWPRLRATPTADRHSRISPRPVAIRDVQRKPRTLRISPALTRAIFIVFGVFFVVANLGLAWCWLHLDTVREWATTVVAGF